MSDQSHAQSLAATIIILSRLSIQQSLKHRPRHVFGHSDRSHAKHMARPIKGAQFSLLVPNQISQFPWSIIINHVFFSQHQGSNCCRPLWVKHRGNKITQDTGQPWTPARETQYDRRGSYSSAGDHPQRWDFTWWTNKPIPSNGQNDSKPNISDVLHHILTTVLEILKYACKSRKTGAPWYLTDHALGRKWIPRLSSSVQEWFSQTHQHRQYHRGRSKDIYAAGCRVHKSSILQDIKSTNKGIRLIRMWAKWQVSIQTMLIIIQIRSRRRMRRPLYQSTNKTRRDPRSLL